MVTVRIFVADTLGTITATMVKIAPLASTIPSPLVPPTIPRVLTIPAALPTSCRPTPSSAPLVTCGGTTVSTCGTRIVRTPIAAILACGSTLQTVIPQATPTTHSTNL